MERQEARWRTTATGSVEPDPEIEAVRTLIRCCVGGDAEACERFQQEYGELIYSYPVRVYRIESDQAGDFYVFAFDRGRIYRRLRTYEGRAPFRAYLVGFVLDDLVLEWKRADRRVDTVSIADPDQLPDPATSGGRVMGGIGDDAELQWLNRSLADLDPLRAAVLKLLHIEDWDLTASEIRALADTSGRSIAEVVRGVDALRVSVRDREADLKGLEDHLDTVHAWLQLYERRLCAIEKEIAQQSTAERCRERDELCRKVARRQQQRAKLLARTKRRKVTAPYKDIAALFNTTVGNIGSYIARARDELRRKALAVQSEQRGRETADPGIWRKDQ